MSARRTAGIALAALTAANFLGYAARNALTTSYDDLEREFAINDSEFGLIGSAFMAGQAIATLPVGWAGDRYHRKRILMIGLVIAAVFGVVASVSTGVAMLIGARCMVGVGCAVIVPVANSLLGEIFEGPRKASRMAIYNLGLFVGGGVGLVVGATPGYPVALLVIAVPTFALALLLVAVPLPAHHRPKDEPANGTSGPAERLKIPLLAALRQNLAQPAVRWLLLSATSMAFAVGGLNVWLVEYLKRNKGLSEQQATSLLLIASVGGLAGIVIGGRVGDYWAKRDPAGRPKAIALAMASTLPFLVLCLFVNSRLGLTLLGLGGLFFLSWYHAPLAATLDDIVPPERSVSAQAMVVFAMHLLGTSLSSWLLGAISRWSSLQTSMTIAVAMIAVACLLMVKTAREVGRQLSARL